MKKFKQLLIQFPEYYLIVLVILATYKPPFFINPIVIVFVAILVLQIVYKNKISGLIIAGLFIAVNLFMLLALISEFSEFPIVNVEALQLLFVGLSLIILNLGSSAIMIFKYLLKEETVSNPMHMDI